MQELIKSYLPLLIAMGAMTGYLHINFASATDLKQVEEKIDKSYLLALKKELRINRKWLKKDPDDEHLQDYIAELVDELCELRPNDAECKG